MKKKYVIVIACVLLLGIILGGWIIVNKNKVKLNQTEYSVVYGTVFKASDIKYEAKDKSIVSVFDDVLCDKIGDNTYSVKFEDSKRNVVYTSEIKIKTVDTVAPVITVTQAEVVQYDECKELKNYVHVVDNVDGDLNAKIVFSPITVDTCVVGMQNILFTVTDSSGNLSTGILPVNVQSRYKTVVYTKYALSESGLPVYSDYQLTTQIGTIGYRDSLSIVGEVIGYDGILQISWENTVAYIDTNGGISDTQPILYVPPTPTPQQVTPTPSTDIDNSGFVPRRGGGTGTHTPSEGNGRAY